MRPKYKFIVLYFWGHKDIGDLNYTIEEKSNELLVKYEEVDIQSMMKTDYISATVIYKVKLYDEDELQDENW
jgi:hypothetical protein